MHTLIVFPTPLDARCELRHDSGWIVYGEPATHPSGRQGQGFKIPDGTPNGHGTWRIVKAPGKPDNVEHGFLFLNDGSLPWPWPADQQAAFSSDDVVLPSASTPPPVEAVQLRGRQGFYTTDGKHLPVRSATGFRFVKMVADGDEAGASAFLQSLGTVNTIRVLTMAWNLFRLDPAQGRAALADALQLAKAHGKYLSVVGLADTKSYSLDMEAHVAETGRICAAFSSCLFYEIGNELSPLHSTQQERLADLDYLKRLRRLIPSTLPVSLGSTHADQDESDIFKDGDLLTVHGARDDGDNGWRWVRHTNEQRALADRVGRYVVNDEPKRDDLSPDRHLGMALLCRLFRLADTFHFGGGLQCQAPTGSERAAFEARQRGWAAIPDDWWGDYANAGSTIPQSPAKSFANAVRVYSSVAGGNAYTLVLGRQNGCAIDWRENWPNRTLVLEDGGCELYAVSQ